MQTRLSSSITVPIRTKRGQTTGTGAAILVLLIAFLIVMYILFLPPQERQALLEEQGPGEVTIPPQDVLLESPGRLEHLKSGIVEHTLPSINLFSTTQAAVIKSIQSMYTKTAWLDTQSTNTSFSIDELANTENILLSFNVKDHGGRLIIRLNGFEIFNGEITTINVDPIKLPKEILKEYNTLQFDTSSVGAAFWRTNEYTLENVKITAEITDATTQEAKTVFHVTSTEKNNVNRAFLLFIPECQQDKIGVLEIFLNNHNIFQAVPDCGIIRSLEVSPQYLINGENSLGFKTHKGVYIVDNIQVRSKLKEISYPSYYFEVTETALTAIRRGGVPVTLRLEFSNDVDTKRADIFVNGHARSLYTQENIFEMELTPFVARGNNVVELRPKTTMDIVNLRVTIG
jgi:hypothetical protein